MSLLSLLSFILGFLFAVYYTFELIGTIPIGNIIKGITVYGIWLLFITTLILLFSVIFNSSAAVAALTITIPIVLSLLSSLTPELMVWSPGML
ncbi:hypothetical protein, partial [Pseudomonas sp. 2995-1]|uniref:hypothetical protein n=1 Tax=Pseudomonas sp. 2995-1 TaxID=1712679 RepID=UPI001C48B353